MVELGEVLGYDVFLPAGILIPGHLVLIHKEDVRFLISVHIRNRHTIPDLDFVDFDGAEFRRMCGGLTAHGRGRGEQQPEECAHRFGC